MNSKQTMMLGVLKEVSEQGANLKKNEWSVEIKCDVHNFT